MYIFLSILIVIASILLIGVVLIQKSKGGGLASDYSSMNNIGGYRKTTDFIEKATWTLAIFICLVSICASFAVKTPVNVSSVKVEAPTAAPAAAPANAAPAAQQAAPAAQQAPAPAPAPAGK